jgi:signal transduction histidine kinase
VAHELRTPVSVLIAEAQGIVERERDSDHYRKTISTTLRSAKRISGPIESLLDLAQIESGADVSRSTCDLVSLSAEVLQSLQDMAEARGIIVDQKLEKVSCEGNAAQITQIITNLLFNAIQHDEPSGHVRIETGHADNIAFISIENTGPGIPVPDLPHVFERFYCTDSARNRKTGGVGLGLAISKSIADAHGAELIAESSAGVTRFVLRMPTVLLVG